MKKRKWSSHAGIGYKKLSYKELNSDEDKQEVQSALVGESIVTTEAGLRYGLIKGLELGAKITFPFTVGVGTKYMFYKGKSKWSKPLVFSVGGNLSSGNFDLGSGDTKTNIWLNEFSIPLIGSYDFNKNISVYLAMQLMHRMYKAESAGGVCSKNSYINYGLNFGFVFGWFVMEYSLIIPNKSTDPASQSFSIGFSDAWNKLQK
jgi:hypothetical protein